MTNREIRFRINAIADADAETYSAAMADLFDAGAIEWDGDVLTFA